MSGQKQAVYLDRQGVADHCGVRVESIERNRHRGYFPEPDLRFLGHPLWTVEIIDEWLQFHRYKRYKDRPVLDRPYAKRLMPGSPVPNIAALHQIKVPKGERRAPRGQKDKRSRLTSSVVGAVKSPAGAPISHRLAEEIAAVLRAQGHYCTTTEALALAAEGEPERLEDERQELRRLVLAEAERLGVPRAGALKEAV